MAEYIDREAFKKSVEERYCTVTHWMPLPEPPKDTETEAKT